MTWVHHAVLAGFGFGVGASVGSFLNVCIWRLPRGESVARPASRCPRCGGTISARDNVPVLSWLALRGCCRHCAGPIPSRYPLVEATVGLLFAAVIAADLAFDTLDLFERGPLGVLALLAYHLALVSLLVTSTMIARDQRISPDPTPPRATPNLTALGLLVVVSALAGTQASDLVGSGLNALLLGVFVLGAVPPRSALRRVF